VHCTKLERSGVPSAPVVGDVFANLVKMHAKLVGMPHHRTVFLPHPTSRLPAEKCRGYIEGNDPITNRPVLDEIILSLTGPLTDEERYSGLSERSVPRLLEPDTEENLHKFFPQLGSFHSICNKMLTASYF